MRRNTWAFLLLGLACCKAADSNPDGGLAPSPDAADVDVADAATPVDASTDASGADAPMAADASADAVAADSSEPDSSETRQPINVDPATGALGPHQCPQYEPDRCPEGCQGIHGFELDEANDCTLPLALLDCSTEEIFADQEVCRVSRRTGRTYSVSVIALAGGYHGWEACSDDVAEAILSVRPCE